VVYSAVLNGLVYFIEMGLSEWYLRVSSGQIVKSPVYYFYLPSTNFKIYNYRSNALAKTRNKN
jgi:hypothetical protein